MKKKQEKKGFWSHFWGLFWALMLALAIRSCAFEPYNIPSASMYPTLLIGDHLFISKYSYGYSKHAFPFSLPIIPHGRIFAKDPKLGDVVVFRVTPKMMPNLAKNVDYIKRVVALPGDKIQMIGGRLYINDKMVEREFVKKETVMLDNNEVTYNKYIETLPNGIKHEIYEINDQMQTDDTAPIIIPDGYFFAMGDNRDNSYDSRFFGAVPLEHLEGKARVLFYSNNGNGLFWQFWKWKKFIRTERLLKPIE